MNAIIGGLAVLLYLLAGAWLAVRLANAGAAAASASGPLALGWGAVLLHASILSQTVFEPAGLNLGFFNALAFTGWGATSAFIMLASVDMIFFNLPASVKILRTP